MARDEIFREEAVTPEFEEAQVDDIDARRVEYGSDESAQLRVQAIAFGGDAHLAYARRIRAEFRELLDTFSAEEALCERPLLDVCTLTMAHREKTRGL